MVTVGRTLGSALAVWRSGHTNPRTNGMDRGLVCPNWIDEIDLTANG